MAFTQPESLTRIAHSLLVIHFSQSLLLPRPERRGQHRVGSNLDSSRPQQGQTDQRPVLPGPATHAITDHDSTKSLPSDQNNNPMRRRHRKPQPYCAGRIFIPHIPPLGARSGPVVGLAINRRATAFSRRGRTTQLLAWTGLDRARLLGIKARSVCGLGSRLPGASIQYQYRHPYQMMLLGRNPLPQSTASRSGKPKRESAGLATRRRTEHTVSVSGFFFSAVGESVKLSASIHQSINSNQIKSDQVRSSRIKSNQVRHADTSIPYLSTRSWGGRNSHYLDPRPSSRNPGTKRPRTEHRSGRHY